MRPPKEVKDWHKKHPEVPLVETDYIGRLDSGETDAQEKATSYYGSWEAHSRTHLFSSEAGMSWWWEDKVAPWAPRGWTEADWVIVLDDFFAPYLAMLPRDQGELVRQLINDRLTYAEVGQSRRVSRQAAHQRAQTALRDLTLVIAQDDPAFRREADGRSRNFKAEAEAAERVFDAFLKRREDGVPTV